MYVTEAFTGDEQQILLRYFTNTDRPVFALKNLPEVVKGSLFARYSRTGKSLRRLFLDEFYRGEAMFDGPGAAVVETGTDRASEVFDRIFIAFGDDSVAQLGGAHVAVEQASNILTKVLEWGRLGAYLEQSTRYVSYADQPGGRYRYYREPAIAASAHAATYETELDAIFDLYKAAFKAGLAGYRERFPKEPDDTEDVWKATTRAKTLDALRGMLPAATVSNLGIFGTGQFFEQTLLRMRAHPLDEVRSVADAMLHELNEVIPVFLRRVEQPDRGGVWSDYLRATREATAAVAQDLLEDEKPEPRGLVTLTDFDPDAEEKLIAAILYTSSDLPEDQLRARAASLSNDERMRLVRAYAGERQNRRHKPGRALERFDYRFDVLADYGAFRDLQRHRMLTIEWQELTPQHGYEMPDDLKDLGIAPTFREAMDRSAALWEALRADATTSIQAQYAVCMAYRVRFVMQMNAREAMHLIELRSSPQGHPAYRAVAHAMHAEIAQVHPLVAELMTHVDHSSVDLERLEAERSAERKRRAQNS